VSARPPQSARGNLQSRSATSADPRRARGVVAIVALVAILVMALASAALLRSVGTAAAVAGNLGFMQAALAAADGAVEHAVATLFELRAVADPANDDASHSYFASRQAAENARGVPQALQAVANYPSGAPILDAGNGNSVRYVIERMCISPGAATAENCNLTPIVEPPLAAADGDDDDVPLVPVFRVSIRVDGPRGAAQFVQAWLAEIPGRQRLAWRALAD
jgi:Tfp pilus assembly protein PilX